jgi:PAS domain S-box-containing protein
MFGNRAPKILAGWMLTFGVLNFAGWALGIEFLVRLSPSLPAMPPNAGLLFFLLGIALWAQIRGRTRLQLGCALAMLALSFLVAMEYITGRSLGMDGLLLFSRGYQLGAFPGRLAPNSDFCFLLVSLGMISLIPKGRRVVLLTSLTGLSGATVSATSGMALLGYLFQVDAGYRWGAAPGMPPVAAATFFVLGAFLVFAAWKKAETASSRFIPHFLAFCLAASTMLTAFIFWQALLGRERMQVKWTTAAAYENLKEDIQSNIDGHAQAIWRLGRRMGYRESVDMKSFEVEAGLLMETFHGLQTLAWADSSGTVRWVTPRSSGFLSLGNPVAPDSATRAAAAAAAAAGAPRLAPALSASGGKGFVDYQPVKTERGVRGMIVGVFDGGGFFEQVLPPAVLANYEVEVRAGRELIYGYPLGRVQGKWSQGGNLEVGGLNFTVSLQPRPDFLREEVSNLPHMVLVGGLLIAFLMGAAVHFGQRSLRHSLELQESNRALESSRESFANIVEKNADGILVLDGQGLVRFANPMAAMLLGQPAEDLAGGKFPHPLEPGRTTELRASRPGGEPVILDVSAVDTHWEGKPALLVDLRDVTERVRTREALSGSESKLRRLVDSNIVGIFFADAEGKVREANDAFLKLTGFDREDLRQGRLSWDALMPAEYAQVHEEVVREVMSHGVSSPHEKAYLRKDGGLVWVLVAAAALEGGGTVAFVLDIGDRKAAEAALRSNEEQMRQSQKMEAVGRLAGGIAHDFNNLLTAINGYSDLLLNLVGEENPMRPHLEEIRKAGDRAAALTRQLLAFSRKQVVVPKVIDVNAAVTDMGNLIRRLIGENIDLKVSLDPAAGRLKADPSLVQQVVLNLAINARDAMPAGGELRIETFPTALGRDAAGFHLKAAPGPYVAIAVKDNGTGMDDAIKEHLFEPFFSTKEKGKGTGLGLSTVYGIVKQFGGAIRVESRPDKGSAFTVYFPRIEEKVSVAAEPAVPRENGSKGDETILLVEDEEAVRKLARTILEDKGYTVVTAADGSEALRYFEAHRDGICLLLTDVVMPGMSGRELAEHVLDARPGIRVIFMSGYTEDAAVQRGIHNARVAFIAKPFSPEGLLLAVRETLDMVGDKVAPC